MILYNENLYDTSLYNAWDIISPEYDNSDFWVNFWDGFKVPNAFVQFSMIGYLDPLTSSYSTTRITQTEQRFTNIKKTGSTITFKGYIQGTSRKDLVEKCEYFKAKVDGERSIEFKDAGVTKGAKVFAVTKFEEHTHTVTHIDYEITCKILDHIWYADTTTLQYSGNTASITEKTFYNNWEETDYIGVLTYNTASNLDVTVSVNGVDIIIGSVNSGDIIVIDIDGITVSKNGVELVFWWILSKLQTGDNTIKITDTGGSRNFDLQIMYNTTIV